MEKITVFIDLGADKEIGRVTDLLDHLSEDSEIDIESSNNTGSVSYVVTGKKPLYVDPEFDILIQQYYVTKKENLTR